MSLYFPLCKMVSTGFSDDDSINKNLWVEHKSLTSTNNNQWHSHRMLAMKLFFFFITLFLVMTVFILSWKNGVSVKIWNIKLKICFYALPWFTLSLSWNLCCFEDIEKNSFFHWTQIMKFMIKSWNWLNFVIKSK